MAKNNKKLGIFSMNKSVKNKLDLIDKSLDDLYSDTYSTSREDLKQAEKIKSEIDKNLTSLTMGSTSDMSVGNLTKLYQKMQTKKLSNDKQLIDNLEVFNEQLVTDNILTSWISNRWIKEQEMEIDMILKYCPRIKEALDCKKDCVLSADHFSKQFTNFYNPVNLNKANLISSRIEEIKHIHKLDEKLEEWYDKTQMYGEVFLYIIPYSREFEKLLKAKSLTSYSGSMMAESASSVTGETINIIHEGTLVGNEADAAYKEALKQLGEDGAPKVSNLSVSFNETGYIKSVAENMENVRRILDKKKSINFKSMNELFCESVDILKESAITESNSNKYLNNNKSISDKLIGDDLKLPKDDSEGDLTATESIFGADNNNEKINIPGCIVKELKRENVIPVWIDQVCLGYYYLEFADNNNVYDDPNGQMLNTTATYAAGVNQSRYKQSADQMNAANQNKVVHYIAQKLSEHIDAKFINMNQDMRRELYMILKHCTVFNSSSSVANGNITVTFIPADDVIHSYFKLDDVTHRGVSDLVYSLFPAKIYSTYWITNVLGQITRGQDKRVYYVKQGFDTNVSATLLNVLNQIKRGNFGARQIDNFGNILNITGRFNDYLIPLSGNGEAPIQIETIQGQQFTDNSELMNVLERMAINPIGIPYDFLDARNSMDFAIQATMSNAKVLRMTYKRQDKEEEIGSRIMTKIYNYEYNENEIIKMSLPLPTFLNVSQSSQLLNGTKELLQSICDTELAGEDDLFKAEFINLGLKSLLPSHINPELIERLKNQTKINISLKRASLGNDEE